MEYKFSKRCTNSNSEVRVEENAIPQVIRFKYLGSIVKNDGGIEGDVNHRIQVRRIKCRIDSDVICDKRVPLKFKGKFYRTVIRPTILWVCL